MNESEAIPTLLDDSALRKADARAVMDQFITGRAIDPAVAMRVRARSEIITAEVYRKLGERDVTGSRIRCAPDDQAINKDQSVNLAEMAALQLEIEYLRKERDLYLEACHESERADLLEEMAPSLEELMRTTANRVNFEL